MDNESLEHKTTMKFWAEKEMLTFKILKVKCIYQRDGSFVTTPICF